MSLDSQPKWLERIGRTRLGAAGDRQRARRLYEWLTITWRDADPELQTRVQEARDALRRLGG